MSSKQVSQWKRHCQARGIPVPAPVSNDISGVIRLRERDRVATQPPPALLSAELDQRADDLEATIAEMQLTVCSLRKTSARLRGERA